MKYTCIRGTRDIFGAEIKKFKFIEDTARNVCALFGYQEIRTPIFEESALFTRAIGESTDIVAKEMYTLVDKKGRQLSLRPEGTAPVVRAYLQAHLHKKEQVSRLFYMGPMFRYERPQAGRYREFWQIGAEVFGLNTPAADAEIIMLNFMILNTIGINNCSLHINSVGCPQCRASYIQALVSFLKPLQTTLCDNCQRRLSANPLRIFDCKIPECKNQLVHAPLITDYLDESCRTHLAQTIEMLRLMGFPETMMVRNPSLVRGLDYYTSTVFEYKTSVLGAQDALSAGGRYNTLVKELGGPDIPAVGFAIGLDRLITLINENSIKSDTENKVFIACLDEESQKQGIKLAQHLREKDVAVEIELLKKPLKSQLSYASDKGYNFVIIIGEDEVRKGCYTLKDMKQKSQQTISSINELIQTIK